MNFKGMIVAFLVVFFFLMACTLMVVSALGQEWGTSAAGATVFIGTVVSAWMGAMAAAFVCDK